MLKLSVYVPSPVELGMILVGALATIMTFVVNGLRLVAGFWFALVGTCGFSVGGPAYTSYPDQRRSFRLQLSWFCDFAL
jgi:hypothetical protein